MLRARRRSSSRPYLRAEETRLSGPSPRIGANDDGHSSCGYEKGCRRQRLVDFSRTILSCTHCQYIFSSATLQDITYSVCKLFDASVVTNWSSLTANFRRSFLSYLWKQKKGLRCLSVSICYFCWRGHSDHCCYSVGYISADGKPQGEPLMPPGMKELILSDMDKTFDFADGELDIADVAQ